MCPKYQILFANEFVLKKGKKKSFEKDSMVMKFNGTREKKKYMEKANKINKNLFRRYD